MSKHTYKLIYNQYVTIIYTHSHTVLHLVDFHLQH